MCSMTKEIENQTEEWVKGDMTRHDTDTVDDEGTAAWMMDDLTDGLKGKDETDNNRPGRRMGS